jgi:CRP-like cAMP-binding protein
MAKKPASALARILVVACVCMFRVDPVALEIVASPVLVRALIQTVARQLVATLDHFPMFGERRGRFVNR